MTPREIAWSNIVNLKSDTDAIDVLVKALEETYLDWVYDNAQFMSIEVEGRSFDYDLETEGCFDMIRPLLLPLVYKVIELTADNLKGE